MRGDLGNYFQSLSDRIGGRWNRFWFTRRDPLTLSVLRVATGLVAIYTILTYSPDLLRLWGTQGMLPLETIRELRGPDQWRPSVMNYLATAGELWAFHAIALGIVAAFAAGLFTRATSVLALIVVLSYFHRAPMLTGLFEPILALVMFYLCLGPSGARLSIDALLRRRKAKSAPTVEQDPNPLDKSFAANIAIRLLQIHLCVVYLMMGIGKIAEPGETWWLGEAVWWLMTRPDSRLVDLTGLLHNHPYIINAWSHAVVLFELSFPILIWNRLARPLLLALAVPMWFALAMISGLSMFCLMMVIANLAFVPSSFFRKCGLARR